MDTSKNLATAKTLYEEVFSKGNIAKCKDLLSQNVVLTDPAYPNGLKGLDAFCDMERRYTDAFHNKKAMVEQIFAADDKVVVRWKCQGNHEGKLNGIAPTHKPFKVFGISIYRFENGKICEIWQNWDHLGLLEQIGEISQAYEFSR